MGNNVLATIFGISIVVVALAFAALAGVQSYAILISASTHTEYDRKAFLDECSLHMSRDACVLLWDHHHTDRRAR